jgi:hypothetical protein
MKSPWKALGWTAGGLATLAALIWLGSFLYWHLRITSSLKSWKEELQATGGHHSTKLHRERGFIHTAGCRALPYVVAALDASEDDPRFQEALVQYLISALAGPEPATPETFRVLDERSQRWEFIASGLDLERRYKLADFRAWWRENGHTYHAWWRTWSKWCPDE